MSSEQDEATYDFSTSFDERVCPLCAPMDGSTFTETEISIFFPFAQLQADGTIKARLHPRCRCTLKPNKIQQITGEDFTSITKKTKKPKSLFAYWSKRQAKQSSVQLNLFGQQVAEKRASSGRFTYWRAARGLYAMRSPQAAMRFGAREAFGRLGLATLGSVIVPLLFMIILPMIQKLIDLQVKARVEAEMKRNQEEVERKRAQTYKTIYREGVPA
jgi:hypothetical protein